MPKRKALGDEVSVPVLDWDKAHVSLNGYGFMKIAEKIQAERAAWRNALGVPRGFQIPDHPLPATAGECRSEIERVRKLEVAALELRCVLPPGQEYETAGAAPFIGEAYVSGSSVRSVTARCRREENTTPIGTHAASVTRGSSPCRHRKRSRGSHDRPRSYQEIDPELAGRGQGPAEGQPGAGEAGANDQGRHRLRGKIGNAGRFDVPGLTGVTR